MSTWRQLKLPFGTPVREVAVKPQGSDRKPSVPAASGHQKLRGAPGPDLMEQVVASNNVVRALKQIERKKDKASGIDGMQVTELRPYLEAKRAAACRRIRAATGQTDGNPQGRRREAAAGDSYSARSFPLRELTSRRWSIAMSRRIELVNRYLRGWLGYFRIADAKGHLEPIAGWLRRRLRMCQWKQWKRCGTRLRHLRSLGIAEEEARKLAFSRKGCWALFNTPQLNRPWTTNTG